ncbi:Mg(2+) transporter [Arthrobotrys megalospora]
MGTSGSEELTVQFSEYHTLHKYEEQEPYHSDVLDFTGTLTRTSTNQSDTTPSSRFNFFPATSPTNIPISTISDLITPDGSLNDHLFTPTPSKDGAAWWLDITNPTPSEIHLISTAFSLHPLTEQDIKMSEARERIELFKNYYYICFHSFYPYNGDLREFNAHVIVFPAGTLSFIFHNDSRHSFNVRTRMARLRDYMTFTSDWICYAIIDDIIDNFTHLTTSIDQETNTLEDEVSLSRTTDSDTLLLQIHLCRQKVMSTTRLLTTKSSIIKTLIKIHNLIPPTTTSREDDFKLYLGDIQDHVITMISNLKHFDEVLLRSRASYLAQISVERIKTKNQIFQTISKCATISAILVSVNIICGLFGMNVRVPGQMTEGVSWWLGIAGVVLAGMLVSTIVAKRKKLL